MEREACPDSELQCCHHGRYGHQEVEHAEPVHLQRRRIQTGQRRPDPVLSTRARVAAEHVVPWGQKARLLLVRFPPLMFDGLV